MIASSGLGRMVSGRSGSRLGPRCPVLFVFVSIVCVGGVGSISRSRLRGSCFTERTPWRVFSQSGLRGISFAELSPRVFMLSTALCAGLWLVAVMTVLVSVIGGFECEA